MKTGAMTLAVAALALAACNRNPEPDAATGTAPGAVATVGAAAGANDAVAAVLKSEGNAVAGLSFLMTERPVVGKPFTVQLLVSAAEAVPSLRVVVESSGLTVTPATSTLSITEAGKPVTLDLSVTGDKEGLAEITVRLGGDSVAEAVYAVPVLVMAAG
jgi:hypothetical protein